MRYTIAIILLAATPAFAADWTTYQNSRYGVGLDVPPGFTRDVGAPENGDGMGFNSANTSARLVVWGSSIMGPDFAADAATRAGAMKVLGWDVTYQRTGAAGWSVLSGTKDDQVFYEKTLSHCNGKQALSFRLTYPAAESGAYESIISRLAVSLHAGPSVECPAGQG